MSSNNLASKVITITLATLLNAHYIAWVLKSRIDINMNVIPRRTYYNGLKSEDNREARV